MKSLEILISASAAFGLGLIWYGLLFKNHWIQPAENKLRALDYVLIFLSMCTVAYFMNNGCLETHINGGNLGHGIFHGGLYGLSYAVPIISIHHIYQRKSLQHFLIDSGYALFFFAAIGGMLALLPLMVY